MTGIKRGRRGGGNSDRYKEGGRGVHWITIFKKNTV